MISPLKLRRGAALTATVLLAISDAAVAQVTSGTAQANSLTPLLTITLIVIGLVILFFGIAWLFSSSRIKRRAKPDELPAQAAAVGAVASYEKARSVAKAANDAHNHDPIDP